MELLHKKRLSAGKARSIIDGARTLLSTVGFKVVSPELEAILAQHDFVRKDGRWLISGEQFDRFTAAYRKRPLPQKELGGPLMGEASYYSSYIRDPMTGQVREADEALLREMTIFSEKAAASEPILPVVPGYPTDIPGELGSLARYRLSLELCHGEVVPTPDCVFASDYIFEMAAAAGRRVDRLPVYPISPLTLGGDSLDIVLRHRKELTEFYVYTMPMMGVTAPMSISMGYAQALAEVVGTAILVEAATGLTGDVRPNLDVADMKRLSAGFGTPMKLALVQMGYELLSALRGEEVPFSSMNIHTFAKETDSRASMEKGMLLLSGALQGAKKFYCVGTLCLDEIFDPLQLLQDAELLRYAQQRLDGPRDDGMEDSFLEEMAEGLAGGFSCADRTLDDYLDYLDTPLCCETMPWQSWLRDGAHSTKELLQKRYRQIDARSYEPPVGDALRAELDAIYRCAQKAL